MTPTNQESTQQVIERAAKDLLPKDRVSAFNFGWEAGFYEGASFALQSPELLKGVIGEVLEWMHWEYKQSAASSDKWLKRHSNPIKYYTTAELVQLYFTHKQKENAGNNV